MEERSDNVVMTTEEAIASMRKADATARAGAVIILVIGCAAAYWVWPVGVTELPLAALPFGAPLRAIASGVVALIALCVAALIGFDWE